MCLKAVGGVGSGKETTGQALGWCTSSEPARTVQKIQHNGPYECRSSQNWPSGKQPQCRLSRQVHPILDADPTQKYLVGRLTDLIKLA